MKPYHDAETLRTLYSEQRKSQSDIARLFNVSDNTIKKFLKRHGIESNKATTEERFRDKFIIQENGCWEWQAAVIDGLPVFRHSGNTRPARRYVYETHVGPIGPGNAIVPSCNNLLCVNPAHLIKRSFSDIAKDTASSRRIIPVDNGDVRECVKCGLLKHLDEFGLKTKGHRGHSSECKVCMRTRYLQKNYGLTTTELDILIAKQRGCCLICEQVFDDELRPAVDHHHASGRVRGILCKDCNSALGLLQDNPQICLNAARYLNERPHGKELLSN